MKIGLILTLTVKYLVFMVVLVMVGTVLLIAALVLSGHVIVSDKVSTFMTRRENSRNGA